MKLWYTMFIVWSPSVALLTTLLKSRCNSTQRAYTKFIDAPITAYHSKDHLRKKYTHLFQCNDTPPIIAQNIAENSSSSLMISPSYKDLIAFGIPTLGIWLLQPILSLIDTAAIGISSTKGTNIAELAAIGPGIAWVDSTAYLCQFLGMATTNLYAVALGENNTKKSITVLSHATFLSIILGMLLTVIQLKYAKAVITIMSGTSKEIIPYAILYSKYRSFGSLVGIPTIIAQSAFLTQKNVMVPLIAVLIGAVVNLLGDGFYVVYLKQGLKGAAIASALSQCASFLYLVYVVFQNIRKMPNIVNSNNSSSDSNGSSRSDSSNNNNGISSSSSNNSNSNNSHSNSIRTNEANMHSLQESMNNNNSINNNAANNNNNNNSNIIKSSSSSSLFSQAMKSKCQSLIQIPSLYDIRQFMSFSGPLFFILLAKSFLWSFTTYACSTAGATKLAAHQITINFYLFFVIFGDVTSQMSQTYLPSLFSKLETLKSNDRYSSSDSDNYSYNSMNNINNNNNNTHGDAMILYTTTTNTTAITTNNTSNSSSESYRSYQNTLLNTMTKIVTIAVMIGAINSGVGYFLQTRGAQMFTKSSEILSTMYSIRHYFVLCVLPFALVAAMEGALVAGRDSVFHAVSYLITGIGFVAYQQYVRTNGLGLIGVWQGFATLQWWRLLLFGSRVYFKFLRRTDSNNSSGRGNNSSNNK